MSAKVVSAYVIYGQVHASSAKFGNGCFFKGGSK